MPLQRKKSSPSIRRNLGPSIVRCYLEQNSEWRLETAQDSDGRERIDFVCTGRRAGHACSDAFILREKFLRLRSFDSCVKFFTQFGPFRLGSFRQSAAERARLLLALAQSPPNASDLDLSRQLELTLADDQVKASTFYYEELATEQQNFKNAQLWSLSQRPKAYSGGSVAEMFRSAAALDFLRPPHFIAEPATIPMPSGRQVDRIILHQRAEDVATALWNSISLDRLMGFSGGICASCGQIFISKARHKRDYCDRTRCNGSRRVRAWRERKKGRANKSGEAQG